MADDPSGTADRGFKLDLGLDFSFKGDVSEILKTTGDEFRSWSKGNRSARDARKREETIDRFLIAAFSQRTFLSVSEVQKFIETGSVSEIVYGMTRLGAIPAPDRGDGQFYYPIENLDRRQKKSLLKSVRRSLNKWLEEIKYFDFEEVKKRFPNLRNEHLLRQMLTEAGAELLPSEGGREHYVSRRFSSRGRDKSAVDLSDDKRADPFRVPARADIQLDALKNPSLWRT